MDHTSTDGATKAEPQDGARKPRRKESARSRGAAVAIALAALGLWLWHSSDQIVPSAMGPSLQVLGTSLALAVGVGVVLWLLLRFVVSRFMRVPSLLIAVTVAAIFLLATLGAGTSRFAWFGLIAIVLICAGLIGSALAGLLSRGSDPAEHAGSAEAAGSAELAHSADASGSAVPAGSAESARSTATGAAPLTRPARSRKPLIAAGIATLALIGLFAWLLTPTGSAPKAPAYAGTAATAVQGDPGQPGSLAVHELTYGSGTDKLRKEYGSEATLKTTPVDLSDVITGWSDGAGSARTSTWGFDASALPVNARVWYPDGAGPYPLVLIVHGNKSTVEFSENGYSYLAELLASQGMVVASIDENFLNTNLLDRAGGIGGADAGRALLILEHLKSWQQLAEQQPLAGKVDLTNIGLVGHSRGGGAVASAAWLNGLSALPDNPEHALDYHYGIKSVVGLAPADGQYEPDGKKVELQDVSYLAVQGSDDVDVASFGGLNQLERTTLGPQDIAAAVYVDGADHSQFNTAWGRRDIGDGATKYFIDTGSLIAPAEQQQVAKTFVSAFLQTTLTHSADYRALFADNRAGSGPLPDISYLSQLRTPDATVLVDGQEDDDKATGPDGVTVSGDGLQTWEEEPLKLRWGAGDNRVVRIAGSGQLTTSHPAAALGAEGEIRVDFALVSGSSSGSATVTVQDAAGKSATVEVTDIPAPIAGHPLKADWMQPGMASEPVLQTRAIPASELGGLDLQAITSVSIAPGDAELYVDNVVLASA